MLYEYWNTLAEDKYTQYSDAGGLDTWRGQTFTADSDHNITSVKVLLNKSSTVAYAPGIITAVIKNVGANGLPTGGDLCSGTTDGDTLSSNSSVGEWREIMIDVPMSVITGNQYALILKLASSDHHIRFMWWAADSKVVPGYYSGGRVVFTGNAGSTWNFQNDNIHDLLFEIHGDGEPANTDPVVEGPIMNVDEKNLAPTPESANPILASGLLLDSTSDAEITVEPGVYVLTPVSGYITLGYGIQNTDANIMWSACTGGPSIHICIPAGITTLHYKCTGTNSKSYLRKAWE